MSVLEPELRPGRFSERFIAYLLDTVPFAAGAAATVWVLGGPLARPLTPERLLLVGAAWAGLAALWQALGNLAGATPGKSLLGLRVATARGAAPGPLRAVWRALAWLFLSTPLGNLGFLVALAHPRSRALHDILAGTYVVEAGPRRGSGALAFFFGAAAAAALFVGQFGLALLRPTPEDLAAVARARRSLGVIARIQEAYKTSHGVYADSAEKLAEASGDPAVFQVALRAAFAPQPFLVEAGNVGWRVTAAARDRRRTVLRVSGP